MLLHAALCLLTHAAVAPPTEPPDAGRVLWLRADRAAEVQLGGTVASWRGVDGAGAVLAQADGARRPALDELGAGGHAALAFDGDDSLASATGMPTGDYTKAAVVVLADYDGANHVLSGQAGHALSYGGTDCARLSHGAAFVTSSVPTALGVPTVLVATYDAGSGEGRLWQDGVLVGTGSAAPHADVSLQVGALAGGGNLHGSLAEVLVYDRVLDDAECTALSALLDTRYGDDTPRIALASTPRDGQVCQRDAGGRARVVLAGTVETAGYGRVELRVTRDGAPWSTALAPLAYGADGAPFELTAQLAAGLFDFDLELAVLAPGVRTTVHRVRAVACGDTFLISGQSNAVAEDYWDERVANESRSHWIRSFGSAAAGTIAQHDLHWGVADGEDGHGHCTIGAWGMLLAEDLVQREGVPVAVLNGAVSGTAIHQHLRYDPEPEHLSTIYGRLLFRARRAGLDGGARALLWHQGESDGDDVVGYAADFPVLYAAWHQDYPALEHVYTFQIRKGCGIAKAGVREFQRRAPRVYADLSVMSTTAAPGHDGCHFRFAGYRAFAERIARLVARDLYGSTDTLGIDAPDVLLAQRVGAGDELLLVFRDPADTLVFEPGAEADFTLNDQVHVVSGTSLGNALLLRLSGPTTATRISYTGHEGDGAWVRNARGVGALTFFKVPILP